MPSLSEMRAERERLDKEIRAAEEQAHRDWNSKLDACESALFNWCSSTGIEFDSRDRKNEVIFTVGHGAMTVWFGYHRDEHHVPDTLRMVSGMTLSLEWTEIPDPDRFMNLVKVLLGKPVGPAE